MLKHFQERFQKLNEQQQEAVQAIYGPVMVIAGPGAGKTELLSLRIANILHTVDVSPHEILCLTFTDAAAVNLKSRLQSVIGSEALKVNVLTFHSFAQNLIYSHREFFGERSDYEMCDEVQTLQILTDVIQELPPNHPLKVTQEGKFLYINDLKQQIADLKRSGFTPSAWKLELDQLSVDLDLLSRYVLPFFEALPRLSKKLIPEFDKLLADLEQLNETGFIKKFKFDLFQALQVAKETQKTKTLSEFKKQYLRRDDHGSLVLIDKYNLEKYQGIAWVYARFTDLMGQLKLFDYTDMLLWVLDNMKSNIGFLRTLQENYQFIMVDEYQDTSGVQLAILKLWAQTPFDEAPNLFVVGDDDQAIYKFSGASVENILEFTNNFVGTRLIELSKNYRSHQDIIDLCANTLSDVSARLCNMSLNISKQLEQGNPTIRKAEIEGAITADFNLQKQAVCNQIQTLVANGVPLQEIAIIARSNNLLSEINSYLSRKGIDCYFEYSLDVLNHPKIIEFLDLLRLIEQIRIDGPDLDFYLLKSIFASFSSLDNTQRLEAVKLNKNNRNLLDALKNVGLFTEYLTAFEDLAVKSLQSPARIIISDLLMLQKISSQLQPDLFSMGESQLFFDNADLDFVQNIQVLLRKMEAVLKQNIKLSEFLDIIEVYRVNKQKMQNYLQLGDSTKAVNLLSAHKSKGLEFEHVIVLEATEKAWLKLKKMSKLRFPSHKPLSTEPDNLDDCLKILYVAYSRAKSGLYLYASQLDNNAKRQVPLAQVDFQQLNDFSDTEHFEAVVDPLPLLLGTNERLEREVVESFVAKFRFSPSSLLSFFDLQYAGPEEFWKQKICGYQSLYNPKSEFGRVIHLVLEEALKAFSKGSKWTLAKLIQEFEIHMLNFYFPQDHRVELNALGIKMLTIYYPIFEKNLNKYDLAEMKMFSDLNLNGFASAGVIDRLSPNYQTKTYRLVDYKTGTPVKIEGNTFKAFKHRMQLTFYKEMLLQHAKFQSFKMESAEFHFLKSKSLDCIVQAYLPEESDKDVLYKLMDFVAKQIQNRDLADISNFPKTDAGSMKFVDAVLNDEL